MWSPGWDTKTKVHLEWPRSLLRPCLRPLLPGGAPSSVAFVPGSLRLAAHPKPRDSKPRHEAKNCQRDPRLFCHIHFAIWQVGVQNMFQEGGSKKFSKSLLGSLSHYAESSASLVLGCPPPAMWCCVTHDGGCQLSVTRKRKTCSRWGWSWLYWLLWDFSRWHHNNSSIPIITKITTISSY